jgi:ComF family protein
VLFLSLSRCPICRERATSSVGCCQHCHEHLFQPQYGDNWLSLGIYQGKLEKAVRAYKFHHVTKLSDLFAQHMSHCLQQQSWNIDAICAVPLHWSRYLERGYNQSVLLAKHLSRHSGLPYQPLLKRTKRTQQQAKLSKTERQSNVQNAFTAKHSQGNILLIDDVITSGATSQACIEALLRAGAAEVKVAAIARATRN